MIPPPAGLRHRRNGQSPITIHYVLASTGRHLAQGIETAGRPASGGMISPPADRSDKMRDACAGRCERGQEGMPCETSFIRRASRLRTGPQQVVG